MRNLTRVVTSLAERHGRLVLALSFPLCGIGPGTVPWLNNLAKSDKETHHATNQGNTDQ